MKRWLGILLVAAVAVVIAVYYVTRPEKAMETPQTAQTTAPAPAAARRTPALRSIDHGPTSSIDAGASCPGQETP